MTTTHISVDEGGLRQEEAGQKRYVPFASIADVELRTRLLRDPAIAVSLTGEKEHELVLFVGTAALEIHHELVAHLEARRAHEAMAVPVGWRRDGRPLVDWLVGAGAATDGGYRDALAPNAVALRVAEDADANVEDRAVAIHLLVRSAEGGDLVRVAKLLAARSMPPIVQVAARLAPGGPAFVPDHVFTEAKSFVSPVDAADPRCALDRAGPVSEDHVAAAAQARREIAQEAEHAASLPPAGRAIRSTASAGDGDANRWIGRSWGL